MAFKFHGGKLAVQGRAGTTEEAARILNAGWIGTAVSSSGLSQIADQDMKEVYISSADHNGHVWASVVVGEAPGFVAVNSSLFNQNSLEVTVSSGSRGFLTYEGDPLDENLRRPHAPVGVLIMGYKNRRRYRIDGQIVSTTSRNAPAPGSEGPSLLSDLTLEVTMAMGNCPKYLHVRELVAEEHAPSAPPIKKSATLSREQRDWIDSSATFILGTYADGPNGGADASNRGGNPGFVRALDYHTIIFPDYKGNNLYLSLGNIAANPRAGLLFINRETGDVLQVSGEAHIVYGEDAEGGGGTLTGKHVRVDVRAVVEAKQANPLRMIMKELSPFNPPLPASSTAVGFGDGAGLDQSKQAMHLMRCREVLDVATGVKAFRFEPAALNAAGKDGDSSLAWTPGQYATFFLPSCEGVGCGTSHQGLYTLPVLRSSASERQQTTGGEESVVRTWTISSVHGDDSPLEVAVQAKAGGVTEHMHSSLKPGDLVRVAVGGDFTLTDRMGFPPVPESKVLLLSAGIGVTPMIGALRWLRQRESKRSSDPNRCVVPGHPDVVAIHASRSREAVPFLSEIIQHTTAGASDKGDSSSPNTSDEPRVRFILATTRPAGASATSGEDGGGGSTRHPGYSTVEGRPDAAMIKREVPDVAERHVMLCGPDAFMVGMEEALRGLGVASSRIHSEEFYF